MISGVLCSAQFNEQVLPIQIPLDFSKLQVVILIGVGLDLRKPSWLIVAFQQIQSVGIADRFN